MNLSVLLLVLTALEGGQFSAAFVNTSSLQECEHRAANVGAILDASGIEPEQLICRSSTETFTPYSHYVPPHAPRTYYVIRIDPFHVDVRALPFGQECAGEAFVRQKEVLSYCASSTQQLLTTDQALSLP